MTYVYIVFADTFNGAEILGVYASEFKANQKKIDETKNFSDITIKKWEVDE